MPNRLIKLYLSLSLMLCFCISFSLTKFVFGASCEVSVSPPNISPNSSGTLYLNVGNDWGSSIAWIKISRPSSNFTISGGTKEGWSSDVSASSIIYTGGLQNPGESMFYPVVVDTLSEAPQENWTVQVSESADGSNPSSCSGTAWVAISDSPADTTAPVLTSDISISGINDYATLTWVTDENTIATVQYGTTDSYGLSKSDSTYATNHSMTINSLSANTTYHFNLEITDQWGNSWQSGDEIFSISKETTVTNTVTVTNTTTVNKTIIKEIRDEIKPLSKLSLDFKKIYSAAPEITGVATDDGGVAYVLYSLDDGNNYIPASIVGKVGSKSVKFKFTPEIRDDGNYKTRVKTIDSSGNESISDLNELIIDRLPPRTIGSIYSLGPLILDPDTEGYVKVMVNNSIKVTLSTVGGPTSLEITTSDKRFPITKNIENGLWSGNITFDKTGDYNLVAHAIDGANNETTSLLGKIRVVDNGHLETNAKLTVFVFDENLSEFVKWNGEPYGILNPQFATDKQNYNLILPNGKYYIEVKKAGYRPIRTNIFEVFNETFINTDFILEKKRFVWDIFSKYQDVIFESPTISNDTVINQNDKPYLPDFEIPKLNSSNLLGKPSLLTIVTTWMPNSSEQLSELQNVSEKVKNSSIFVVVEEATDSGLSILKKIGGYDLDFYADPDGKLYSEFNLSTLPTHIFINRQGEIKKVISGFLPSDEILKNLLD